jgi:trehalose 6-phosphate synthase
MTTSAHHVDHDTDHPIVIASNRGPISFDFDDDGSVVARRGAGGLVSGLGPLVTRSDTTWVAAAMSDADRTAATRGVVEAEGFRVRSLALDEETYRLAYDVVSNEVLWFAYHGLWDLPREPSFGRDFRDAWAAYRTVNAAFADAIADVAPDDAIVLVQDYHLALVGRDLAERRHDLRAVHFSHTPFAELPWLRVLPEHVAGELLGGMAAHHACGFHTSRWAHDFALCCREVLGLEPTTFVSPLASDPADVRATAASPECDAALARLEDAVGDRLVIARVDRIELSKNLLRGFAAFGELLERRPEWRERVVFVAAAYPSREGVSAYRRYRELAEAAVEDVNRRFATDSWQPITFETDDDYARSIALLRRYDVLLINPVRDGLNLVAKEGALVNERGGTVLLSTEAGAFEELATAVVAIDPFDVAMTADALDAALRADRGTRDERAARLRALAEQRTPAHWLADQRAAAAR